MNVHRHVQMLGGFEDGPEFWIVQIFAARVAVDDGAFQSELAHAALQFLSSADGILRSDGRETGETVGIFSNCISQLIVERLAPARGFRRVENLNARCGERKDLHRDAGVVHIAQTPFAQVLNALGQRGGAGAGARIKSPQAAKSGIVVAIVEQLAIARDQLRPARRLLRWQCADNWGLLSSNQDSVTNLVTRHASRPSMPSSLPWPLSLMPPNGESRTEIR